jgi:excinuclease ABC subunit C
MVVFKNGLPAKSEYRKFRIKTKQTPDDFGMMKEMLSRRMSRVQSSPPSIGGVSPAGGRGGISKTNVIPPPPSTIARGTPPFQSLPRTRSGEENTATAWPLPDLIVIDGGKGQLSAALKVLHKFQISPQSSDGVARRMTVAKKIEEIFVPGKSEPIILSPDDPALQLLQRLRDEAHRFGITYHRQLRSKQAVKSALDDIPGIGPKTKKLLKAKFGTVADIRKTDLDTVALVVGDKIARNIKSNI